MKLIHRNLEKGGCSLVAAYNAASLCGMDLKYKDISDIADENDWYEPVFGMSVPNFHRLLEELEIPVKLIDSKIDIVKKGLKDKKHYLLAYRVRSIYSGHIINVYMSGNKVEIDNPNKHECLCSWKKLYATIKEDKMSELYIWELSDDDTRTS